MAEPSRPPDASDPKRQDRRGLPGWGVILLMLVSLYLVMALWGGDRWGERSIGYSDFKGHLAAGEIQDCRLGAQIIHGKVVPRAPGEAAVAAEAAEAGEAGKEGGPEWLFRTVRVEDPGLVAALQAAGVEYTGVAESRFFETMLLWLIPLGLMVLLLMVFLRRLSSPAAGPLSFGKSRAKLMADMNTGVTFEDVAGCDEAKQDLREVVDFLKNPDRYSKLGARVPKGMLLVGPPGTGKTLLARAIAGEAEVPFFSISGSEFVEMFVGVGAARVRDLFEQAIKKAPCIVFIDEIDAIGRSRGVHMGAVNDEREQTLNQLLVELDGFEANNGVILLAATNRPDVLDRALLRPGRFDRQVVLDVPDVDGRRAILGVHARGKPLAPEVDLEAVARATPGFAGADLSNALNEAALLATRRGAKAIAQQDIEAAIERLVAGPERKSRRLSDQAKRRVAYHEAGHAVVAHLCEHADPVHKISIIPRGRAALGFTMQLPEHEQAMQTRTELEDQITGMLGGRAAELLVFGEASSGAANDLERATATVRQMVCLLGMGESAGLMQCAHEGDGRFPLAAGGLLQRDCSEQTAHEIDQEVKRILDDAHRRAGHLLGGQRDLLERVARALLERETLDRAAFEELVERHAAPAPLRTVPGTKNN